MRSSVSSSGDIEKSCMRPGTSQNLRSMICASVSRAIFTTSAAVVFAEPTVMCSLLTGACGKGEPYCARGVPATRVRGSVGVLVLAPGPRLLGAGLRRPVEQERMVGRHERVRCHPRIRVVDGAVVAGDR